MTAGDPLVLDDNRHNLPQTNLVDLLEARSVPWKACFENYPGQCNTLLRTIEDNFGLGTLGRNDASATPFAQCNFTGGC